MKKQAAVADMSELLNYKVTKADLMELMEAALRKKLNADLVEQNKVLTTVDRKVNTEQEERDKTLTKRGHELAKVLNKHKPKAKWYTKIVATRYGYISVYNNVGDSVTIPLNTSELAVITKYGNTALSKELSKERAKYNKIADRLCNVKHRIQEISAKITHDAIMSSSVGRQILSKFKIPLPDTVLEQITTEVAKKKVAKKKTVKRRTKKK